MLNNLTIAELTTVKLLCEKELKSFIAMQGELIKAMDMENIDMPYYFAKCNINYLERLINKLEIEILKQ